MFGSPPRYAPQQIGFVLLPRFSMIAFTSAIEVLRLANRTAGRELYAWSLLSVDGRSVCASNGIEISVEGGLKLADRLGTVVLCSGIEVRRHGCKALFSWLRRMDRRGADLGALCTASFLLAQAGLLDGYRATIHWENLAGLTEEFPNAQVTGELFEIDRNRFTCSGGTAALDLMLNMVVLQYGQELAASVADQCLHERIRDRHDRQRVSLPIRLGVRHPRLLAVIEQMEANLEEPLERGQLAEDAGLSTRQLERLFRKYLNRTPARYYLELRLSRARLLLTQTNMSVIDVALACGFVSASHFSKCYRDFFGHTPRRERGLADLPEGQAEPEAEAVALAP